MNQPPPNIDALKRSPELAEFPDLVRGNAARQAIANLRQRGGGFAEAARIAKEIAERLTSSVPASVLNMSGVVLHTGLGRARLAKSAANEVARVARGHAAVEFDLEEAQRGDRQDHLRDLLVGLTGAEDALVVNNCAAAVLLALTALCRDREVVLSRGQMVEIGGAFRMPDVVRQSGCRLVEVGCTNKTRPSDYKDVIGPQTGAILRCHPSNFRIVGFHEEVGVPDLARLAHNVGALLIDDAGSGCLVDTRRYGLPKEPTIGEAVAGGADVVTFSGDKLVGGPQAGIAVGSKAAILTMKSHPLARALRIDKLTVAGLAATLRLYRDGRESEIPVWSSLARPLEAVFETAQRLASSVSSQARVVEGQTEVGGGSLPGVSIPTWCVAIDSAKPLEVLTALRHSTPPIIGRIDGDMVLLDPRTLDDEEASLAESSLSALSIP